MMALPADSLLRIPLVSQMMRDRSVSFFRRRQDSTWMEMGLVPKRTTGFRPFFGEVMVPEVGRLAAWLKDPAQPARPLNVNDELVRDVLFLVHDYLHGWAYNYLRERLGFDDLGFKPIDSRSLERYVYLHLLTETAATVGLDYWYLSEVELNNVCNLGTTQGPLTVHYHRSMSGELTRLGAALEIQTPDFFGFLQDFYCSGEWLGLDAGDVKNSPILLRWMRHEIGYGETQRIYSRRWLRYLAGLEDVEDAKLAGPVRCSQPWQRTACRALGAALWTKVKEGRSDQLGQPQIDGRWTTRSTRIDPRWRDITHVDEERLRSLLLTNLGPDAWACFAAQYISSFHFSSVSDEKKRHLVPLVLESRSTDALFALMRNERRLDALTPVDDVMFLS